MKFPNIQTFFTCRYLPISPKVSNIEHLSLKYKLSRMHSTSLLNNSLREMRKKQQKIVRFRCVKIHLKTSYKNPHSACT